MITDLLLAAILFFTILTWLQGNRFGRDLSYRLDEWRRRRH